MQAKLFEESNPFLISNLLPKDGEAFYYPEFLDEATCALLFDGLMNSLNWQQDQLHMFGRKITTQRKVAWVGDPNCAYTYSGVKKQPQPWTPELLTIKNKAEELAKHPFNSCLLNLYHHGNEGMGWHSDNEPELDKNSPIVSISLGGVRKFAFKHKLHKTSISLLLGSGSALIMHAPTQEFWNHSLLKTKTAVNPRINLTFRTIKPAHE
jgi:alkylated DNA repair dioxygenase AlkB